MRQARIAATWLGFATLAAMPALAADVEPSSKIVRSVERLADKQALTPREDGDTICRWATQTMTYQGVGHTRRVRVCEKRSWWDDLLRKSKTSTSRSRPRPN